MNSSKQKKMDYLDDKKLKKMKNLNGKYGKLVGDTNDIHQKGGNMKYLLFTFILYCMITVLFSIQGDIYTSTWSADQIVTGDITVIDGETLTIDHGVTISFSGHYKFNVQGCLLAEGTINDSIIFTAIDQEMDWFGIRFTNTPVTNDSSRITYCKIEYGDANGTGDEVNGGGIYIKNFDKVIISYSNISNNHANEGGAGICCYQSSPLIEYNKISNNHAGYMMPGSGGGAAISLYYYSSPVIRHNEISYNYAYSGGGILCSNCSSPIISHNYIHHNVAITNSGIWAGNETKIINNILTENHSDFYSGALLCKGSGIVIANNTITNNSAWYGGGMLCTTGGTPNLVNNIFWGNDAPSGNQIYLEYSANPNFYNCDIQGGFDDFSGDGVSTFSGIYSNCIDIDPLFSANNEDPLSLSENSPCRNSGNPDTSNLHLTEYDFAGKCRIQEEIIDIGAYEWQLVVQNLIITESNDIINLSWDAIPIASMYNIYESDYPDFTNPIIIWTTPDTTWSTQITCAKKFYRVTYLTE